MFDALDKEMLLAKVLAAAYVVFGVFALMVVSIRDNRRDMFMAPGENGSAPCASSTLTSRV